MFFKKKIKNVVKEFFNWVAFSDEKNGFEIKEPITLAKIRLEEGAKDYGANKALHLYNSHSVKIKNQWINPLNSINTGFGSAQYAYYNYQSINYWQCSALAQDPLFNKIFNILSKTPFANDGMVSDDLSEKDRETLQEGLIRFKVKENLEKATRSSFVVGGSLIYMDFGLNNLEEPLDLKKMNMKQFKGFRRIEPINITAVDVNTTEPAKEDYMNPKKWYVIGLGTCDASHFLKFEQNEPELVLKPMCMYFGMPLTELIKQDVANSNMASQGLANLMNRFRYLYLKTDRSNFVSDGAANFKKRLEIMSMFQDNHSIYPLENTEEIMQFVTPVTGMSDACEFFYQIIASKTDITISILLGKGAQGLSGTLEGERKNFYDRIRSIQSYVKPNLLKMYGIVYGYMTDGKFKTFLDYNFNPLEQSSEKEKAENLTRYVDVADKFLNMGVPSDDVMDWLKTHKDLNLENMTIEEKPENYEMGADGLGDEQQGFDGQEDAPEGEKQAVNNADIDYDNVDWITVKGVHIPIMKGQSQGDAIKDFFAKKNKSGIGGKEEAKPQKEKEQKKEDYSELKEQLKSFDPVIKKYVVQKKDPVKDEQYYKMAETVKKKQVAEQEITKDVTEIMRKNGGEPFGLDYRLKTEKSAIRKARDEYEESGYDSPEEYLEDMWDLVRYTQQNKPENMVESAQNTLSDLESRGYIIKRVKNTYIDNDNPYNGVNVKVISPKGAHFELQFNTPRNLIVKEKQHELYEVKRQKDLPTDVLKSVNDDMWKMNKYYEDVPNIERLKR